MHIQRSDIVSTVLLTASELVKTLTKSRQFLKRLGRYRDNRCLHLSLLPKIGQTISGIFKKKKNSKFEAPPGWLSGENVGLMTWWL